MSSKNEERVMHSRRDNRELMINDKEDEVNEISMTGSDSIFDCFLICCSTNIIFVGYFHYLNRLHFFGTKNELELHKYVKIKVFVILLCLLKTLKC